MTSVRVHQLLLHLPEGLARHLGLVVSASLLQGCPRVCVRVRVGSEVISTKKKNRRYSARPAAKGGKREIADPDHEATVEIEMDPHIEHYR